jgi:glutamate/tyrosine decarboxylase-like PLP-dependent enzyme
MGTAIVRSRTHPASNQPQASAARKAEPTSVMAKATTGPTVESAVMDPRTENPAEVLELIAGSAEDYLARLSSNPVRNEGADDAALRFGGSLPADGDGAMKTITELLDHGLDAHIRSSGPRFFHWVLGGATPAAIAADWLVSLLDQNAGGWDGSPLAAQLERLSIAWLCELFGLPVGWGGVLTTGATMANFTGLAAARQWWGDQHGADVRREGLAGLPPMPVLSSGFIHVSSRKALGMLGVGKDGVRVCAADATGRLDVHALERELQALDGAPAIVIGNAGEVNAGYFDPIATLADLTEQYGAWLHVDGAFGLFARISPRTAQLAEGVERAHSVISDGHKWLNVPYDCGFCFVREQELLAATFNVAEADYLPNLDLERPDYGYLGPEMSRRARSLPVWATLAAYGRNGYRVAVERNLDHAQRLAEQVRASSDFELLADVPLNIVCFRYRPTGVDNADLDDLNLRLGQDVLADGRIYVGTTRWAGRVAFRPAFVNWRTTDGDVDLLLTVLRELGERLVVAV